MNVSFVFIVFALLATVLYAYPVALLMQRVLEARPPVRTRPVWHEQLALSLALVLHALTLSAPEQHWSYFGIGQTISLTTWIAVLLFTLGRMSVPLEGVQLLLLGSAVPAMWLGALLPPGQSVFPADTFQPIVMLHVLVAMFSYGLMLLAVLLALLMLLVEDFLHRKRGIRFVRHVPPLLTLEYLLFAAIWSSFILLTLTLLSGGLFSEQLFGVPFTWSHKTVLSLLGWLILAVLLYGRWRYGWRGRVAARWTLCGGALLFLAYIGTKMVLQWVLQRGM